MADEVVRVIRVRGVPEGLENLTAQLKRAEQAYSGVGTAASGAGTATETSARKLNTTERSYRSLTERLDSTVRLYRQLQTDTRTLSGAFDAGFMGKGAEAAARFNTQLRQIQQNLQDAGGRMATGGGISAALDSIFDMRKSGALARDSAAVFEAELARLDGIATLKARSINDEFWRSFNSQFSSSGAGSARASASVFEAHFANLEKEIAARAGTTMAKSFFQNHINDAAGISGRLSIPSRYYGTSPAQESASAFIEQDAAALAKLQQAYDPILVNEERRNKALKEAADLQARGALVGQGYATVITNVNKVHDDTRKALEGAFTATGKYSSGMGLARHELINLSRQAQDVAVSLASGQSPLTVLIQQGTQIADVFAASRASVGGFFAQAARGIGGFAMSGAGALTGGALLGAGVAAAAYQYAESQRAVEIALMGVGRASGQTLHSINQLADAAAEAGKISRASARDIASIFVGTGRIDASVITPDLIDRATKGFSTLTGQSQRDAAIDLAKALASPTAGAAELEKRLGSLSDAQMQFIKSAEAAGNRTAAQKALFDTYNPTLSEAAKRTNEVADAFAKLARWASNAWDAVGRGLSRNTLEQDLENARRTLEAAQRSNATFGFLGATQGDISFYQKAVKELEDALKRRDAGAADARSSERSQQAGAVLRDLFGDESRLQNLKNQRDLLNSIVGDSGVMAKLGPLAGLVAQGVERLKSSVDNFETTSQRIAKDNELQIASINAYTLAQKIAVESERARVEAIRGMRGEVQAGVEAEQARSRAIADANRQLRDTARDLRDAGSLIGLSPFQRSLQEARNQSRREADTLSLGAYSYGAGGYTGQGPFQNSGGALPASTTAMRGLDEAFAESLRKLMAAVPGLGITSGFRTYEEQARLYREKPGWAARPGTSNHEFGVAADLNYRGSGQIPGWVREEAAKYGIHFPLANRARNPEPWHAEPVSGRGRAANDNLGAAGPAANAAAREANALREAYEGWNTPLANAERQLAANNALLDRQKQAMFQSTEEVAKAAEKQRLINEYMAQGIPITAELAAKIENYGNRFGVAARQAEELQRAQEAMRTVGELGRSVISGMVSDLRNGASGADMFRNALDKIASKLLDMALNDLFGKAFGNNAQGLFGGGGFFSSLFSGFGRGGTPSISSGTGGLYATGGYTGAGGKYDPAGIVHRGEYVFSAASVNRLGVGYLDGMHRSSLKGYADGGYVSPAPYLTGNDNAANSNLRPQMVVNVTNNHSGAQIETRQNSDGSLEVIVDQLEARFADRMTRGQGSLSTASRAVAGGRQLRG